MYHLFILKKNTYQESVNKNRDVYFPTVGKNSILMLNVYYLKTCLSVVRQAICSRFQKIESMGNHTI
jgi:hypothetical protein